MGVSSTMLQASPLAVVIDDLLEVQDLENKFSTLWMKQAVNSINMQSEEASSEADEAKSASEHAAQQIRDQADGLFGSAATLITMGGATIGLAANGARQEKPIRNQVEKDGEFLKKLRKTSTSEEKVSSLKDNEGEISKDAIDKVINAEWDEGEKANSYDDVIATMEGDDISKAKENTQKRIDRKQSEIDRIARNISDRIQYMRPFQDAFSSISQATSQIYQASEKTREGEAEAKKIMHQQGVAFGQGAQQTADKAEDIYQKDVDAVPQLLGEIENANLFRA